MAGSMVFIVTKLLGNPSDSGFSFFKVFGFVQYTQTLKLLHLLSTYIYHPKCLYTQKWSTFMMT